MANRYVSRTVSAPDFLYPSGGNFELVIRVTGMSLTGKSVVLEMAEPFNATLGRYIIDLDSAAGITATSSVITIDVAPDTMGDEPDGYAFALLAAKAGTAYSVTVYDADGDLAFRVQGKASFIGDLGSFKAGTQGAPDLTLAVGAGNEIELAITVAGGGSTFDLPVAIHGATAKATLTDLDQIGITDSAAANGLKKVLWSTVKSQLLAYFDTLYARASAITSAIGAAITSHAGVTSGVHGISGFGASLVDDVSAPDARDTLGLGTLATQSGTFSGTSSGTNTGDNAANSLYSGLVSNATHTGDVTGATALTIANGAVTEAKCNSSINASLDLADSSIQPGNAALTDTRTPTAHKSTHATGGADALTPGDIGAAPSTALMPNTNVTVTSATATADGSFSAPVFGWRSGVDGVFSADNNLIFKFTNTAQFICRHVDGVHFRNTFGIGRLTWGEVANNNAIGTITNGFQPDGANVMAVKNASAAQKLRVYGDGAKYAQLEHNGTDGILSSSSGRLRASQPFGLPSYTVSAALALVGMAAGDTIYVSNETGGACLATYNGTAWKRQTDLATIS